MWQYLQSKWQSLIFRLLLYFVVSMLGLAIVLSASFANRFKPHFQHTILPNVDRYIQYLINDIGMPPDLRVAQQLASSLPFEIRIEGRGIDWSSSPGLKAIDRYEFESAPPPYNEVYFGRYDHDNYLLIQRQSYRYLFVVDNRFRRGDERRHWVLFLLLGAILFLLYLAIRRMFRPIQAMSRQVKLIGEGELDQTIEANGKGELALLAGGINRMSAQIKSMLESKSGLLLAISHELRSPITRMRVNLELLDHSDIQRKLIDDVREMEALVAAILESERLNNRHAALTRSQCDLLTLIQEVVVQHPCADRIETSLSPVQLNVDQLRIKLLLKNLIDNACHYSSRQQQAIEISLRQDNDSVIISVRDHGDGIEAEEIPRLTEAFYRSDQARQRNTGGYGLGLYLCKLIVDAHDGELLIESEPGSGTCVVVKLPL